MERRYLFAAIMSLAVIAFLYSYLDSMLGFSDRYIWWDSLEHFLGGVTVGFAALFLITLLRLRGHGGLAILLVFAVGLAWEIMEYVYGIGGSQWMGYWTDTAKDLVLDCLGGYVAVRAGSWMRHL